MSRSMAIDSPRLSQSVARQEVFEQLWQDHRERIWRLVARLAGGTDIADDLTQEISIRAFSAFEEFRGESSFSTWLYRIAVNIVLRYRERKLHSEVSLDAVASDVLPDPAANPETQALQSALRPAVWAAINRLPPDLRTTLILQVYEGLKYREIAAVLNITLDLVKYRRHQALLRLREELQGYEL